MTARFLPLLVCLGCLAGCLTPEVRRQNAVRAYLIHNRDCAPEVAEALRAGVVLPGMPREAAFLAAGHDPKRERMTRGREADAEGRLLAHDVIVCFDRLRGEQQVWLEENTTQFGTAEPEPFVVLFDGDVVSRIDRGATWRIVPYPYRATAPTTGSERAATGSGDR